MLEEVDKGFQMTITSMWKETEGKTDEMDVKMENFNGVLDLKKNQVGILVLRNKKKIRKEVK